eukprot:TRINITY_DN20369_c0_g1_i1.p1 TRINITY_DN20369_c0_g1~~TRINITY_DN20369_c0_g1_i1.p1  ORF type:complete len:285 (+),score=56.16 TRINITY_DN20369_c0_g1_i1:135-989(+)
MRFANALAVISQETISEYPSDIQVFKTDLIRITKELTENKTKALWINVHTTYGVYIASIAACGYSLHRTEGEFIVFAQWLSSDENKLPHYGTHIGGACGIVHRIVKSSAEPDVLTIQVLMIREKARSSFWEFPGGAIDPCQYAVDAAIREVEEEVGLKVIPVGFAGVWEKLYSRYGSTSCYFAFVMALQHESDADNITLEFAEVEEARWIDLKEISGGPFLTKKGQRKQVRIDGFTVGDSVQYFCDVVWKLWLQHGGKNWGSVVDNRPTRPGTSPYGKGYMYTP